MSSKSHTASHMAFLRTTRDLKVILFLTLLVMSTFSMSAYGQAPSEFGYRILPSKIVENTEGVLQVYVKSETAVPREIHDLVVTTSDSSIIQILGIEKSEDGFITPVRIKGIGSGTANIALAASGFLSQEIPITIYSNKHNPTQLLIKTTPNTFSPNGPTKGYVSVEITDGDGFPTKAVKDIPITLTTSTSNIVNLKSSELLIKKGEYFAIVEFEVNQPGNTLIYASSPNMETVSSKVTLTEAISPTVQLYVYPNKINSFSSSYAYAIVQLLDSSNPVKAQENIVLSLQITDPNLESVNTSGETSAVTANEVLEIKKGSYWGYVKIVTRAGLEGTYDIRMSAKDYLVSASKSLEIVNLELLDDKSPKFDVLPILATGKEELIGVMHLEDDSGNPVAAKNNLQIKIDSSDEGSLSINDVRIDKGFGTSLVFGKVGYVPPSSLTLRVVTEKDVSVIPTISGSTGTLVVEPAITKILSNTNFPLILYMKAGDDSSGYFPEDTELSISPNEFIKIEPKMVKKGQSVIFLDSESLKSGSTTISLEAKNLLSTVTIESLSSKPATIQLDRPEKILSSLKNTFSIQILDSQSFPVFADHDIEFQLVANDPSVLTVPAQITIKKGEYYALFDVEAKKTGTTELAVLTSEIPLSKFDISIDSLIPVLSWSSQDYVNQNTNFDVAITAQYSNSPLSGLNVEWSVQGAAIQNMDSTTNENGMATISLLSQDPTKVDVQATVSGSVFGTTTVNKQINVNLPLEPVPSSSIFDIGGINPLLIIIPVAVAAAFIILKKKNMLEGITEKLNLGEKISEIKEKLQREK